MFIENTNFAAKLKEARMFIVILFIFLGIGIGYVVRTRMSARKTTIATLTAKATTWLIWLLLFMLGLEVGSNEQIIAALPTLGVEALLLSACAVLGSCALAWALWKTTKERRKG